jgi:RNA ligase (TIGR02306 family)
MENLNSVCYIAPINEIKPIPGADNIEQGIIGGWNCIIKKNTYRIGDLVVVATTDAIIPQKLSDEMNVTNYLRKGQRVRTVKLKGVYSECLIIPISFIPDKYRYEGADCMELMGIFKYEPPVRQVQLSSGRKIKYRDNPNFPIYYKFPNFKNVTNMFDENDIIQITRKIHGTNARYGIVRKSSLSLWDRVKLFLHTKFNVGGNKWKWAAFEWVYGSHNVEKGSDSQGFYSTDVWREVADKYKIKDKFWDFVQNCHSPDSVGTGIVLYGEIYGPGIQKNYDYGLSELEFAGFDTVLDGEYLTTSQTETVFHNLLGLSHVPILYVGEWSKEICDKYLFNSFISNTKIPHEGIVVKLSNGDRRKVAKMINPDYLIFSEKHNVGDSH